MAERSWTRDQRNAFEARGGTLLVSAAAGSGKTAVLVERVLESICDEQHPVPVDRLLIATFTKAAAAEMRERIGKALSDRLQSEPNNHYLIRQKLLLPAADICTIDSFCNALVRENYHKLGISPDYRLVQGSELDVLRNEAAGNAVEQMYAEKNPAFHALAELFVSGRSDASLIENILRLYDYAQSYPFPEEWLLGVAKMHDPNGLPQDTLFGEILLSELRDSLLFAASLCDSALRGMESYEDLYEKYSPAFLSDKAYAEHVSALVELKKWDEIKNALENITFEKLKPAPKAYKDMPIKTHCSEIRKAVKSVFEKAAVLLPATEAEYKQDAESLAPIIGALCTCVLRFKEELSKLKQAENALDFSDAAHLALSLLVEKKNGEICRTPLADELSEKYEAILLDEYQDTNEAQDMLFSALSRNGGNLFMVGDVKQSIYRFRMAMPEIFLRKRDKLPLYENENYPAKIILDRNFRSRKGVTDCINFVFRQVMSAKLGDVEYTDEEALRCAAAYPEKSAPEAELHILDMAGMAGAAREEEGAYIAEQIALLMQSGMTVKGENGERPLQYRDICILFRSLGANARACADALSARSIPSFLQKSGGFFQNSEISVMLSLLKILDNPLQDVPLLSVLLSPIYGFSPDDIAELRIASPKGSLYHAVLSSDSERARHFLSEYRAMRRLSTAVTADSLLRTLYARTAYPYVVRAMENGEGRYLNLMLLLQYASDYEATGRTGLAGFIRYIEKIQKSKSDLSAAAEVSESADVVRMMTIHKSKGLEFPVVILANCGGKINKSSASGNLLIHPKTGVGMLCKDDSTFRKFPTVPYAASKAAILTSDMSEELRVLYVAMTRAREKLVLTGCYANAQKRLAALYAETAFSERISPAFLRDSTYYLDILASAFLRHKDANALRDFAGAEGIKILPSDSSMRFTVVTSSVLKDTETARTASALPSRKILDLIAERVTYEYPYAALSPFVTKKAASEFSPAAETTDFFASARPAFLSKGHLTPAERGTAAHAFLELCEFSAAAENIEAELSRLLSENKLTKEQGKALETEKLQRFFKSGLYRRIALSARVQREFEFTIAVPLSETEAQIDPLCADEKIIVQGKMDCVFFENGEAVIVDYKTDKNADPEALRARYRSQLKIYKRAAEEVFGCRVKETVLFAISTGESISLAP